VEVAITRVPDEDPPRFTGFVRDLTAQVQSEREREQLLLRESTARREAEAAGLRVVSRPGFLRYMYMLVFSRA